MKEDRLQPTDDLEYDSPAARRAAERRARPVPAGEAREPGAPGRRLREALSRLRRLARGKPTDRFFDRPMKIGFALYAAFASTFSYFQVKGDALVYFNLLRKFFGADPDFAFAYQFGNALWNAPFYLVGKALGAVFGFQPRIFHVSFEEISITVATNAAFVLTLYLGWRILRELDLPRGPAVLFLTAFGSPLFYYVVFDPAGKHAVDTLALTASALALFRTISSASIRAAIVLGALAGWAVNIRAVNAAFFLALLVGLLLQRRYRHAAAGTAVACVVAPLILILPALRGIPYQIPDHVPFGPKSVTERTGWARFNGASAAVVPAPAFPGAKTETVEVIAAADGDGAYADVDELTPDATYEVSVFVRGSSGGTVAASAESPPGTFQAYLGTGRTELREEWQRLSATMRVGDAGVLRLVVASASGAQEFYVAARQVELRSLAAAAAAPPRASFHLAAMHVARPAAGTAAPAAMGLVAYFDASIPVKMLISEHRGLFIWTPLTALAALGFLLAVRRARPGTEARLFLLLLLAASGALLAVHAVWEQWDGGFAFSQRFLAALFPVYLIGAAELVRRARWVAYPAYVAAALFSVSVAFVHDIGYDGISERDGLAEHVRAGWDNRRNMRLDVQDDAKARWVYLWGLLEGRDSKCIHEPPGTTDC